MVKTTNAQLDNDKSYKYGCNNDGYGNYSYRSEINGVKCHNSKRMNDQFDIQAEKLVSQLEFLLRDDAKHFTPKYFEQSAFRVNPLKLLNKIHMKLVAPYLKEKKLVHTSESVSYKKSEELTPLNNPIISESHIQPSCPVKPSKPIKKSRKIVEVVEAPIIEVVENITDSDDDIEVNNIYLDIDNTITTLSDSNKYDIKEICIDYVNIPKRFHIVLKDFSKNHIQFTYMKLIYSDTFSFNEPTFMVYSIDEFDDDFIIDRSRYNSNVSNDYYEIIIESKNNIHNDSRYNT